MLDSNRDVANKQYNNYNIMIAEFSPVGSSAKIPIAQPVPADRTEFPTKLLFNKIMSECKPFINTTKNWYHIDYSVFTTRALFSYTRLQFSMT